MEQIKKRIIIIGGGITGLSAAYYTKKIFEAQQIPIELTLIEKSDQLGGKIQTLRRDGFVIEKGPDSFLARKTAALTLTKELGIEDELVATNPNARTNYILHKNKLHTMPLGLVLGIPTEISPFIKTGLISPFGKIRAALDLFLPKKKESSDESLGDFIQRRLGKEVLEHITEPLLGGIYAGDTHTLSLKATFPHFLELEQRHRSLIKGMTSSKKVVRKEMKLPDIARNSMFLSYKNGMDTLVDSLTDTLSSIQIMTEKSVGSIISNENGYSLTLDDETMLEAEGLILAVPTHQTAKFFPELNEVNWLEKIKYVSVANIAFAYNKEDISFPLDGSGFLVPHKEGRVLTACTWTSSKWNHVAPKDKILLRCYVGREKSQEWTGWTDERLLSKVYRDLREIMGIKARPLFHEITRAIHSMPQYPVHHIEHLEKVRNELEMERPGVFLCGAGYEGVGVPDCIQQGKNVAEQLFNYLNK